MKRIIFLFAVIGISTALHAQNDCNIPINEKRILSNQNLDFFLKKLKTDTFTTDTDKRHIPVYIREKLRCLFGNTTNPSEELNATDEIMANPSEDYNATDVISDVHLPWRQLLFFALNKSKNVFLITYYKGGVGRSTITIMMRLSNQYKNQVRDIWIGQTLFGGSTLPELIAFIQENRDKKDGVNTNMVYY